MKHKLQSLNCIDKKNVIPFRSMALLSLFQHIKREKIMKFDLTKNGQGSDSKKLILETNFVQIMCLQIVSSLNHAKF